MMARPPYGHRTAASRCPYDTMKIVRTLCGHRTNIARTLYDFHLNTTETLRFPYDVRTISVRFVDESQSKKSHDDRMNSKRIHRRPTMSENRRENRRSKYHTAHGANFT